jgi:hypothetical protein
VKKFIKFALLLIKQWLTAFPVSKGSFFWKIHELYWGKRETSSKDMLFRCGEQVLQRVE